MERLINGVLRDFLEVNPSAPRQALADEVAREAARVLQIAVPSVRFFYRDRMETLLGFTDGQEIFVGADLDASWICKTVVHEARHLWQDAHSEWRRRSSTAREMDARLFEISWPR